MRRQASRPSWRCASTPRGCSAAIRRSCCTAAATPRSRPRCAISPATRSRCCASRAPAATWARSSPPACRRCGSRRCSSCATLDDLSDDDMARVQRGHLLDPMAPSPSVELLLHAFMPHKFVDHTHANAVLSLIDQPDGAKLCEEVYDGRIGLVPYVHAGLRPRQGRRHDVRQESQGRRADPRQARHLHLRRERQGILRAHDRAGQPRRGAAEEEPQGGVQTGATAAAGAAERRRRADRARRLQPEGRRRRRRAPAHDPRIPRPATRS